MTWLRVKPSIYCTALYVGSYHTYKPSKPAMFRIAHNWGRALRCRLPAMLSKNKIHTRLMNRMLQTWKISAPLPHHPSKLKLKKGNKKSAFKEVVLVITLCMLKFYIKTLNNSELYWSKSSKIIANKESNNEASTHTRF